MLEMKCFSSNQMVILLLVVLLSIDVTVCVRVQIIVKDSAGQTDKLDVDLTQTIQHLKDKIFTQAGIPQEQQRFIFDGKEMENQHTLSHYDVNEQSVIQLFLMSQGSGNGEQRDPVENGRRGRRGAIVILAAGCFAVAILVGVVLAFMRL